MVQNQVENAPLLGGDANDQAKYAKLLNTVSLDHNAAMRLSDFGKLTSCTFSITGWWAVHRPTKS